MTSSTRYKILGAIEALQGLLDWSDAVLVEIDRDTVAKYLAKTKAELEPIASSADFKKDDQVVHRKHKHLGSGVVTKVANRISVQWKRHGGYGNAAHYRPSSLIKLDKGDV